jgi:hypothetical protein
MYASLTGLPTNGRLFCSIMMLRTNDTFVGGNLISTIYRQVAVSAAEKEEEIEMLLHGIQSLDEVGCQSQRSIDRSMLFVECDRVLSA